MFVMFRLTFIKFRKFKSLHYKNKRLDLHKTLVFHCSSHSLFHGAKTVFKILSELSINIIRLKFGECLLLKKSAFNTLNRCQITVVNIINNNLLKTSTKTKIKYCIWHALPFEPYYKQTSQSYSFIAENWVLRLDSSSGSNCFL